MRGFTAFDNTCHLQQLCLLTLYLSRKVFTPFNSSIGFYLSYAFFLFLIYRKRKNGAQGSVEAKGRRECVFLYFQPIGNMVLAIMMKLSAPEFTLAVIVFLIIVKTVYYVQRTNADHLRLYHFLKSVS